MKRDESRKRSTQLAGERRERGVSRGSEAVGREGEGGDGLRQASSPRLKRAPGWPLMQLRSCARQLSALRVGEGEEEGERRRGGTHRSQQRSVKAWTWVWRAAFVCS